MVRYWSRCIICPTVRLAIGSTLLIYEGISSIIESIRISCTAERLASPANKVFSNSRVWASSPMKGLSIIRTRGAVSSAFTNWNLRNSPLERRIIGLSSIGSIRNKSKSSCFSFSSLTSPNISLTNGTSSWSSAADNSNWHPPTHTYREKQYIWYSHRLFLTLKEKSHKLLFLPSKGIFR